MSQVDGALYKNEDWIREKYLDEDKNAYEIADIVDVSRPTICNWLKKFGIERDGDNTLDESTKRRRTESFFRRLYIDKQMSCPEIADEIGLETREGVRYWLEKHGIERRSPSIPLTEDELYDLYHEQGLTCREIGNRVDRDSSRVVIWLDEYDIESDSQYGWGSHCTTDRGEKVRSNLERQTANWLFHNDVEYEYEPNLETIHWVPDFRVDETIIEVWGMTGVDRYDKRKSRKLRTYDYFDIEVISIIPGEDWNLNLDSRLSCFC